MRLVAANRDAISRSPCGFADERHLHPHLIKMKFVQFAHKKKGRLPYSIRSGKGSDLMYGGKVDHGFDKVSAANLQKKLKSLIRKTQPYAKRIAHKGIWVEPKLLAEIEYRAKSAEGKVRHPFFKDLREDL
jgi:ATP-dependent DNA ligase